jgi:hypothetical protein
MKPTERSAWIFPKRSALVPSHGGIVDAWSPVSGGRITLVDHSARVVRYSMGSLAVPGSNRQVQGQFEVVYGELAQLRNAYSETLAIVSRLSAQLDDETLTRETHLAEALEAREAFDVLHLLQSERPFPLKELVRTIELPETLVAIARLFRAGLIDDTDEGVYVTDLGREIMEQFWAGGERGQ